MSERYQGLRFERKRPKWLVPVIFVSIIIVIIGFLLYINHTYDDYLKELKTNIQNKFKKLLNHF